MTNPTPILFEPITPMHFGAVGDGTTDDTDAVQAAVDYAADLDVSHREGLKPVDGLGRMYGISRPISLDTGLHFKSFSLRALPSSEWDDEVAMLEITCGWSIKVSDTLLFAEKIAYNALLSTQKGNIFLQNVVARNFRHRGFWIAGDATLYDCRAAQYTAHDVDLNDPAKRTAYSLYLDAGSTDTKCVACGFQPSLAPVYVDHDAHHIQFIGCHFFQNRTDGTPWSGRLTTGNVSSLMEIYGYAIQLVGCYLDLGAINYYVTRDWAPPDLIISGCTSVYNPGITRHDAWVRLHTSVPNTPLDNLKIAPSSNRWAKSHDGGVPVLKFLTSGGGSWAANTAAAETLLDDVMPVHSRFAVVAGNDTVADPLQVYSSYPGFSLAEFRDASTRDRVGPQFGSNGDDAVVRTSGALRLRVSDQGLTLPTVQLADIRGDNPAKLARPGTLVHVQNGELPVACCDGSVWFYTNGSRVQ